MTNSAARQPSLDDVFVRSPDIVAREIAGECLLVPIAHRGANLDAIYNLNRVGAFIWRRMDGLTPGHAIVGGVAQQFAVEPERAAADFSEFASLLLSIGAISAALSQPR
jgi:hypothetical protein